LSFTGTISPSGRESYAVNENTIFLGNLDMRTGYYEVQEYRENYAGKWMGSGFSVRVNANGCTRLNRIIDGSHVGYTYAAIGGSYTGAGNWVYGYFFRPPDFSYSPNYSASDEHGNDFDFVVSIFQERGSLGNQALPDIVTNTSKDGGASWVLARMGFGGRSAFTTRLGAIIYDDWGDSPTLATRYGFFDNSGPLIGSF
jgi:hypothetical protein